MNYRYTLIFSVEIDIKASQEKNKHRQIRKFRSKQYSLQAHSGDDARNVGRL
ncbi:MAG: hypothetical protein HKP41_18695 [Desulfobacterales bacterium]|nr:hypothetical protein [Desulfobacterales bacterium]